MQSEKISFTMQPSTVKEETGNRIQMAMGLSKPELGRERDIMEPDMSLPQHCRGVRAARRLVLQAGTVRAETECVKLLTQNTYEGRVIFSPNAHTWR